MTKEAKYRIANFIAKYTEEQPERCLFNQNNACYYPIDDCRHCPIRPENHDPYFGITHCQIH